ncbi:hypothetical protein PGT21_012190 [Puccinia graminis f. sp. tritici]|uniref:Uncharacterized protein n=1 Tax=Puccinia graminis f. sp. tritici TaxID=56615 RepID=A0A5B0Q555_PUCGR|nr:hypothetical protein PGT21_012190 [Puccinia graminis f. sp. tritici]
MRYAGSDLISLPWSACVLHRNSTNSNFNIQLELQFCTQPTQTSIPYSTNSNFNSVLNQLKHQVFTQDSSSFSFQDSRFLNLPGSPLSIELAVGSSFRGSWFVVIRGPSWNLQGAFERLIRLIALQAFKRLIDERSSV